MYSIPTSTFLLLADLAALGAMAAGVAALRRLRPVSVPDTPAAFEFLEKAIQRYAPELPPGYTWHEAIERIRGAGVDANWGEIKERVEAYEAFRYGGRMAPTDGKEEVVSLALKMRGLSIGKRTKR